MAAQIVGVASLVASDPSERVGAARVLLDRRQGVVEDDRVALELEVVEALRDVDRGHGGIVGDRRRVDSRPDAIAPTRHRSAISRRPTSLRAMPDLDTRLALAEQTMTALVAGAELPPKIGIHPRPEGSFVHAMPAHLRGRGSTAAPTTSSG